ncbi:ArnT family glycosyltransferase [Candidatus Thiodictyon syntrophicum]|jgi:4-amino-4-deoxy-L-arabinose transferase-like glycosyltransferase|uniref:Glycosyltransferase RgtA/B/C/D-like domain-containing protein n=1 Tax=Candidatus Thiodictyon syntrophicum TaxID=1166950 RepID=A0A2K8U9V0_9GAMM|nr:glycosyltransferase family 39 protein [Candidatus Thiodictyon syntrophicum]AUB82360.1 hypothetical protein THSYN_16340 [Candidatus Thiodictyon syntrophicum]
MMTQESPTPAAALAGQGLDWLVLGSLLVAAAVLQLLLFNGFFGSDDLVYLDRSLQIANGIWSSADYNGALRYGYNIPAALPLWLFGPSTLAATLWPFVCSLVEVAAVYVFLNAYRGRRAALYGSLLLASAPLHLALATRIHSDSVLACALVLSFMFFFAAERSGRRRLYLLAGVAMGMVFWVKELAVVALLVFLTYPLAARRVDRKWLWTIAGGALMLAAHLLLMQAIAGDPLHAFRVVLGQVGRAVNADGAASQSPWYYFGYLLFDVKHTFLLAWLSLAALVQLLRRRRGTGGTGRNCAAPTLSVPAYTAWWLLGLLAVLSFLPVSLDPFILVQKQSNYLNLFLAPMAILGGAWLAQLSRAGLRIGLLSAAVVGGLGLGVMEQAAYQVFTANSKAAVELALAHPQALVVGSVNNVRMAGVRSVLDSDPGLAQRVLTFDQAGRQPLPAAGEGAPAQTLAIIDRENQSWGNGAVVIDTVPACWTKLQDLNPRGMGLGVRLLQGVRAGVALLPGGLAGRLDRPLRQLVEPAVATVYRVSGDSLWCGQAGPGAAGSVDGGRAGAR